jgi:hypothetical protein
MYLCGGQAAWGDADVGRADGGAGGGVGGGVCAWTGSEAAGEAYNRFGDEAPHRRITKNDRFLRLSKTSHHRTSPIFG